MSPAVIGYYDRLSGSFQNELRVKSSPEKQLEDVKKTRAISKEEQSPKPKLIVSKIPTKPTRLANVSSTTSPKLNSNQNFHPNPSSAKTLQIISPSVHRMISSHQTTAETITTGPTVKSFIHSLNSSRKPNEKTSNLQSRRIFLKSNLPKPSGFSIPLSKNLSKISQTNGLVDSEEPIVHTITDNNCNTEEIYKLNEISDSEKTPTNCDHNFNYENNCIFNNDDDDDDIQNVLNRTSELINNLLIGHNTRNSISLENQVNINNSTVAAADDEISKDNKVASDESTMKAASRHKYKLHLESESEEDATCHAVNTNLKFTKSLDSVAVSDVKPTYSPKLSYSRAKLLSSQQSTNSPKHSPKLSEKRLEIVASDSKLNASPSSSKRPLSAASISSSSSSTSTASSSNSFGAENIVNGKLIGGITYLASIESLADHSENEGNPSLTMCERAALEIIESEKSYVADLGQIIRG